MGYRPSKPHVLDTAGSLPYSRVVVPFFSLFYVFVSIAIVLGGARPASAQAHSASGPGPATVSAEGGFWHDHGAAVVPVAAGAALLTAIAFVMLVRRFRRTTTQLRDDYRRETGEMAKATRQRGLAIEVLESLSGHVAVLDRRGTILAVNDAWNLYGAANGIVDLAAIGPAVNYLEICARAARDGEPGGAATHEGIEAVCTGQRADFEFEYRSDGPLVSDWFQMKVTALRGGDGGAVVSHRNITALMRQEIGARARAQSTLVDALPVAVKIVDANGLSRYFNTAWLRMTHRPLDQELGQNWMTQVHPDDRAQCERVYGTAIESHQSMTLEYRLLSVAGTPRWLLDHVVPWYDDEGRFAGLVCAAVDITERRLMVEQLRELAGRLVTAQEDERHRIARELHDDLQQRLAFLAIDVDQASAPLAQDDERRADLSSFAQQIKQISHSLRALSHELHSTELDALGLVPAIRKLARELSAKGLRVAVTADDVARTLSAEAELGLFRIVQESLSNVLKHSGVQDALVVLRGVNDAVTVHVEDHGRGFDAHADFEGLGLLSMKERLTPIGGEVHVHSRPDGGTTVDARVPRLPLESVSRSVCA